MVLARKLEEKHIMARIRIGTASWIAGPLIESGLYYPDSCTSAEDRLRFYSAEFPLVEVDSTYYGIAR